MNLRQKLEQEMVELQDMLQHATDAKFQGQQRLHQIAEDFTALDQGKHFTQVPGDTLSRIVVQELAGGRKVIKT